MKIKTQLNLIIISAIAVLISCIGTYIWLVKQSERANRQGDIVRELNFQAFQGNQSREEYFRYGSKRSKQQWRAISGDIDAQLKSMESELSGNDEKNILKEIILLQKNIAGYFDRLIAFDNSGSTQANTSEIRELLISQMVGCSNLLFQERLKLSRTIDQKQGKLTTYSNLFTFSTLVLLGLVIITFTILVIRRVTRPLMQLKEGTRKVAEGKFDFRLNYISSDEIGDLARDFDLMTEQLTKITVSRDELRESEERLRVTLDVTKIAVWDWNIAHDIWYASPEYFSMLGYEPESGPSDRAVWLERIHPEDREIVADKIRRVINDLDATYEYEVRMLHADGSYRWHHVQGQTVERDLHGKATRMLGVRIDVTDRKRSEIKLQEKNTELDRFAYTVSHDLKSPLITIQAYAGMIKQNLEAGKYERVPDDMKRIEGAADKMNDLLNDLLELSRAGKMMGELAPVDMNRVVKNTLQQLTGPIARSRAEIVQQPDLPPVFGDEKRIAEVVQNLVENAIKYMGNQAVPRIEIGTRQEGKECVFFVSDNGKGIDPRHFEKVFGLFNKLDAESAGTGIGLALVKRIIEVHGGRVWVESDGEGLGSCFCFELPLATEVT